MPLLGCKLPSIGGPFPPASAIPGAPPGSKLHPVTAWPGPGAAAARRLPSSGASRERLAARYGVCVESGGGAGKKSPQSPRGFGEKPKPLISLRSNGLSDRNRTCIWRLGGARSIH